MKQINGVRAEVDSWRGFSRRLQDALELAQLDDESLRAELEAEISAIESELEKRSFTAMLSGKYDHDSAILAIHAGAGGTDSQDWAAMLERMYLRWAEARGYETEILDITEGEEAGIKSVTIAVDGEYAFGYLRSEKGVHRLVRLSPYDAAHRRHTSFALVEVLPQVAMDEAEIDIKPEDIKLDVFRSVQVDKMFKRMQRQFGLHTSRLALWSLVKTKDHRLKTVSLPCAFCAPACWN